MSPRAALFVIAACGAAAPPRPLTVPAAALADDAPAVEPAPADPKDPDHKRGALPDDAARITELRAVRAHLDAMYAHRAAKLARYQLDEDALFADAERRLVAASTWAAYDAAIYQLLARFHDDHLTYHPPITARPSRGYTSFHLGLDTVLARDHLLVTAVEADSDVARAGVKPGDEVTAIDGVSTADVIAREVRHRAYSRVQAAAYGRVHTWSHVLVPKGDPPNRYEIRVRLRGNGTEVTIAITPRESHEHRDQASIARDGDVAIVTLRSLATKKDAADIDHALAAARAAKALVIDLRGNHGGVDQVGSRVVAGLAEGTAVLATYRVLVTPATVAAYKKWAHLVAEPDGFSPPQRFEVQAQASGKGFHGPIAIVVDAGCASTCEVVAGALRGVLHASVVGETTAGSSGAPVSVELPVAHGTINIPAWDLISADGHAIEDEGVAPDVEAIATPDALAAGIDLPLRTAIDAVKH